MKGLPENLTDDDKTYFKYEPITSTNVEHGYSKYTNLVADYWEFFKF